jgi:hypothetical protein
MLGAAFAAAILMSPAIAGADPAEPVALPVDMPQSVNGLDVACTGIGMDARNDPAWATYTVRVEFSNARNEYLTGGVVQLSDANGRELLRVSCDAPWVVLRLPQGRYRVSASMPETAAVPRSAALEAPDVGQLRVVLQFRDL